MRGTIEARVDAGFAGVGAGLALVEAELERGNPRASAELAAAIEAERANCRDADGKPALPPPVMAARAAFKALGRDPSRYRPSTEALIRRLAAGKPVPNVNAAVDTANLLALRSGFCVGVHDRERVRPPLTLRAGGEGERYASLAKGELDLEGLPVLADAKAAFGTPLSDSRRAATGEGTAAVLVAIYGFGDELPGEAALELAAELFEHFANARIVATATAGPNIFGAMKGSVTIPPGVDLTEPLYSDEEVEKFSKDDPLLRPSEAGR